jgi:hypothetical protein
MKLRTGIFAGEAPSSNQPRAYYLGIGDVVADLTHISGLDKLSNLYEDITGKSCGCDVRREKLNTLFPI